MSNLEVIVIKSYKMGWYGELILGHKTIYQFILTYLVNMTNDKHIRDLLGSDDNFKSMLIEYNLKESEVLESIYQAVKNRHKSSWRL